MKKTIVAVMVAASAVLSAQAMAANTAEVTVLGEVNDSSSSCVVTPTGTLNNGIVRLTSVTTSEANAQTANVLFKSQKF
ncbi:type 1 fimbrial protein, partial [Klebsiella aerogenes]